METLGSQLLGEDSLGEPEFPLRQHEEAGISKEQQSSGVCGRCRGYVGLLQVPALPQPRVPTEYAPSVSG